MTDGWDQARVAEIRKLNAEVERLEAALRAIVDEGRGDPTAEWFVECARAALSQPAATGEGGVRSSLTREDEDEIAMMVGEARALGFAEGLAAQPAATGEGARQAYPLTPMCGNPSLPLICTREKGHDGPCTSPLGPTLRWTEPASPASGATEPEV